MSAATKPAVTVLSTFGLPVRGVSPYSDQLYGALQASQALTLSKLDYAAIYPAFVLPMRMPRESRVADALVRWNSPASWRQAAAMSMSIMHIQYWTGFSAPYQAAIVRHLQRQGKRCVVTVHNPAPHEKIPLLGAVERTLLRRADRLIVHSASGRDMLASRCPGIKAHIRVIPHGIARREQTAVRTDDYTVAGLDPQRRYALIFGNLRGYKGVPTLLKAWRLVIEQHDDIDLLIAGRFWNKGETPAGTLAARILGTDKVARQINAMLADRHLASRVILRDQFVADEVINASCRVAELAVFPYDRFSGQSGAASRAASWGTPVVVSRTGALPSIAVDDTCIFEPGDHKALAAILERMLAGRAHQMDLRQRQLAHLAPCHWDRVAAQHVAIYGELAT